MSIAGIEFEDDRISFDQFREMREQTPLSAVPVVEIDGITYTQSKAMARYFGRLGGLYPENVWQAFLCDEAVDIVDDAMVAAIRTFGLEGDALKQARDALVGGMFARCLALLESRLDQAGQDYFCDGRLTMADITVFLWTRGLTRGVLDHVPTDLVERTAPHLAAHRERIAQEPAIHGYYEARLA